jgi:hypothetical protein
MFRSQLCVSCGHRCCSTRTTICQTTVMSQEPGRGERGTAEEAEVEAAPKAAAAEEEEGATAAACASPLISAREEERD